MIKCINCEHYRTETDDTGYTEARCKGGKSSKKGKMLTWACTTVNSPFEPFGGLVKEYGNVSVEKYMKDRKTPKWCPLNKE